VLPFTNRDVIRDSAVQLGSVRLVGGWAGAQFAERSVQRSYLSVTCGVPEPKQGRVVANIGRSMVNRKAMAVVGENTGRHAASKCVVLPVCASPQPQHRALHGQPQGHGGGG
jgi:hypothetical protein